MAFNQEPQSPTEQLGGKIEEQIEIAKRSLNYPGRFGGVAPSGPGTTANDDRWAEIEKAAGVKK